MATLREALRPLDRRPALTATRVARGARVVREPAFAERSEQPGPFAVAARRRRAARTPARRPFGARSLNAIKCDHP
jgi:hypothetical protein